MKKKKEIPVTSRGQWDYPGQPTIVPSPDGRITMKGVPYPVMGVDENGFMQFMLPGGEYSFPGQMVYEQPMMQDGGPMTYETITFGPCKGRTFAAREIPQEERMIRLNELRIMAKQGLIDRDQRQAMTDSITTFQQTKNPKISGGGGGPKLCPPGSVNVGNGNCRNKDEVHRQAASGYGNMEDGGEMIRRADGSYSRRGLWDNIRANKGSGKKPTKEMLEQERKIRREEMAEGGAVDLNAFYNLPQFVQTNIFQDGGEPDGQMALTQINAMMDRLENLRKFVSPDTDLDPWISDKLLKILLSPSGHHPPCSIAS